MLSLQAFHLTFSAATEVRLQKFAGSAWRGAFGHALKRVCCVMRLRPCEGCALEHSCVYPTVFAARPHPSADRMRRYPYVPQPYVLRARTPTPCELGVGDLFELEVVLVGRAAPHVAYIVHAVEEAARHGVGRGRGRLRLESVEPLAIPPASSADGHHRLRVDLLEPTRLVRDGRLVGPRDLDMPAFLMTLVRRVSMLAYFHEQKSLDLEFRTLKQTSESVALLAANVHWQDQIRRSARQQRKLTYGGLVGAFDIDLAPAPAFLPFLRLGEWVHVGKGATMGMGRFRVQALEP